MHPTKSLVHWQGETAKLKSPRRRSKKTLKLALKLTFTRRRREFEPELGTHLDDVVVVAVTNFCSDFNKIIQSTLVTAGDELAAHVKQMHLSQTKKNKNTAAALYQQCLS